MLMFTLLCAVAFRIDFFFFFLEDKLFCCYSGYGTQGTVKTSGETKVLPKWSLAKVKYSERNKYIPNTVVLLVLMVSPDVSGGDLVGVLCLIWQ